MVVLNMRRYDAGTVYAANWEPTINFSLKLKFKKYPFELQKQIDKAVVT